MIKKKICMLGSFAVGKTSLVQRYVENIFSEKYQTTIGVKISKKTIALEGRDVELILWDLAGKDGVSEIRDSYLRGTSGYLLVVDKTRIHTLDVALGIHKMAQEIAGKVPFNILVNKWDIEDSSDDGELMVSKLRQYGQEVIRTSAKTGMGVNQAFEMLAKNMISLES
ncbi:MAG: GTP-binding protein [Dehalococcoidales bacterium]|nr:GTP-binding protein [Dehalococcoidales bacterium]MDX9803535.1 Rab family GTPase [Dehalococcoidales bacterium]